MKILDLLEANDQKFADKDSVAEYLVKLGSAADVWMSDSALIKLMTHLNSGGKVKAVNVDASSAEDKDDAREIFDRKIAALSQKGWKLFAHEWDGSDEMCDVILVK